jgi:hypothetical protein
MTVNRNIIFSCGLILMCGGIAFVVNPSERPFTIKEYCLRVNRIIELPCWYDHDSIRCVFCDPNSRGKKFLPPNYCDWCYGRGTSEKRDSRGRFWTVPCIRCSGKGQGAFPVKLPQYKTGECPICQSPDGWVFDSVRQTKPTIRNMSADIMVWIEKDYSLKMELIGLQ